MGPFNSIKSKEKAYFSHIACIESIFSDKKQTQNIKVYEQYLQFLYKSMNKISW